ncbi:MAG TPA: HDOD domain-containing protein [Solirubrobacteraceae bacterium]|jgi:HD-like signal output (HDOD) protein|nr:HDOD domain-containing protein [Solirubrobacteraceae bacterium]
MLNAPPPVSNHAEPKRILFVDDEPYLLDGIRDALRPYRNKWTMEFVSSGEEALGALASYRYDVIVSDLMMPVMDGATLLNHARTAAPEAARIVLSGHAELRIIAQAAGVAHQLLAKPCETRRLVNVIERCCQINEMIARVQLNGSALSATMLPSTPRLYRELSDALASEDASLDEIGLIVEQDVGISAKILQLANSEYFGRRDPVTRIADAVLHLGLETLQALVLQADAFQQFVIVPPIVGFELDRLELHCYRVGHLARALLAAGDPRRDAFTAGLLHDIGLLVLASQRRDELTHILDTSREQRRPAFEVEGELCDVTHAEIGAYLLTLWGVPLPVAGAVLTHQEPPPRDTDLDEVTATYIANILVEEIEAQDGTYALPPSKLDPDHLEACGLADRLPRWRELAATAIDQLP